MDTKFSGNFYAKTLLNWDARSLSKNSIIHLVKIHLVSYNFRNSVIGLIS